MTEEKYPRPAIGLGFRVGKLTVVESTDGRKNGYTVWRCRCDCGGEILLDTRYLQRGTVRDCGCETVVAPGQKDLTGQRFGQLTALYPTDQRGWAGTVVWRCQCDCGNEIVAGQVPLQNGKTKSCGCLQKVIYKENLKLIDGTSVTMLEAIRGRLISTNTSGCTGVYWEKRRGKWVAKIGFKRKTYYLGLYDNFEDAVKARKRGEEMHEDFLAWYYEQCPEKVKSPRGETENSGKK